MRVRRAAGKILAIGRCLVQFERPIVLMYHRVTNLKFDPWELAVAPERFDVQIEELSRSRRVVPMRWLANELRQGRLPRHVAAITFDDAYSDVLHNALPILKRHDCPATVYAVSEACRDPRGFWWDDLARVIFEARALPDRLVLELAGKAADWPVGRDRRQFFVALHAALKPLAPEYRNKALAEIAKWAGNDGGEHAEDFPMTVEELRQLGQWSKVEIGAHSRTHPSLPCLDAPAMKQEIASSRNEVELMTGLNISGFAYPYGDHDERATRIVAESGMTYAVTAEERAIRRGNSPFKIPRIVVGNWDRAEFRRKVLSYG